MSYRNLRRAGTPNDIVRRLIEAEQQSIAEKEPDDFIQIEEGRLDFEHYNLDDSYIVNQNSKSDNDGLALQDFAYHAPSKLNPTAGFMVTNEFGVVDDPNHLIWLQFEQDGIDVTMNQLPATLVNNPSFVRGPFLIPPGARGNYAISLPAGPYVQLTETLQSVITNALTICAWVKWHVFFTDSGGHAVLSKSNSANNGFALYQQTGAPFNKLQSFIKPAGSAAVTCPGTSLLSTETWYFVALTYDGATIRLYLNGVLENSAPCSGNVDWTGTIRPLLIGSTYTAGNQLANIDVAHPHVYKSVLSAAQLKQIMARGQLDQPFIPGLCNVEVLA